MSEVSESSTHTSNQSVGISSGPTRTQLAWVIVLLAILVVGLASILAVRAAGAKIAPIQQWQYTIVSPSDTVIESKMDELGKQGWELVFARRAMSGPEYNRTASYEMIFKRPVNEQSKKSED